MPPTDLAELDAVVEDGHLTYTEFASSPAKMHKDAHTPSKPNWALAPKSSSVDSHDKRNNRRRRGGKTKEGAKDSGLRHRRSTGRGQPRCVPEGRNIEGDMKNISPSTNRDKTKARTNGPHSVRQSCAHSTSDARSSRVGTPSKIRPWQDNLSPEADTRSALHLAQVDALIKELQKTRGLAESAGSGSGQRTPNSNKGTPLRASLVSSAADMPQGQVVWIVGYDGVLRPGFGEQIESSRLPPSSSPSAFLPSGVRVVHSYPMQRDVNHVINPASGYPSLFVPGPRRSPEPRPFQDFSTSFPAALHGANSRIPDTKRTVNKTVRSGQTPSSQATGSRLTDGGPRNWRSAKLSKNPSPASTRGPSPSPISRSQPDLGQSQRWPTLEEICAMKSAP
ncbi:hypothetical protein PHLGIDRAFT_135110 [Phlebiopsis gigantea 11061_1 CR5-6]|uniref:Uncharacterized protein n=1 Tax=Phlebiopsis gigantea (strain 11061_1 CR5-6) TaxID=745531 RepID=A0A0C3S833_PHLG1|nr:hypothetical protein PHLGIDRAFT_135110 [Phlebiopsis gigantea 11061_1 CR5-6]